MTAVRRTQLAALTAGLLLLMIGALTLPLSDTGTTSHSRGTISQLHRLVIEAASASTSGKDVRQAAADQAILAALVLFAAVSAVLIGARQRNRRAIGRLIPAARGRGPPS